MEIHNLDKITIIFAKADLGLNEVKQCSEYEVLFFYISRIYGELLMQC